MGRKMHYPGSTHVYPPAAIVVGVKLVDERSEGRIDLHFDGTRGGIYMNSINLDGAVTLMIALDREVRRLAEKDGFTSPAFVRWRDHRRNPTP